MSGNTILLAKGPRDRALAHLANVAKALPQDKAWRIVIEPYTAGRSLSQNRTLWWLLQQFIDRGGEALRGYSREELHEVLLEQFSGFEKYTLLGVEKTRPLERSSTMNKQTFSDYIEHVVRVAAGMGIVLELPNEREWR